MIDDKNRIRKIILFGISLLILSCGGGGGSSSAPSNNSYNKPTEIISNGENNNSNLINNKNNNNFIPPKNEEARKSLGANVKVGVLDADFLSEEKRVGYGNNETFKEVIVKEFGDRLSAFPSNGRKIENIDSEDGKKNDKDKKDNHGIIVSTIIGGKSGKNATGSKIYAMTMKDGSGLLMDLDQYKEMKKLGVKIYNHSFGTAGNTVTDFDTSNYKNGFRAYFRPLLGHSDTQDNIDRKVEGLMKFYDESVRDGALFIWAAGNTKDGQTFNEVTLEAGLPYFKKDLHKGWLAVVGVKNEKREYTPHLAWAGHAKYWTISANGDCGIVGCNGYGSSFATPRVSGTAARIKERFPWMKGHEIQQTILTTAKDMGDIGVDTKFGWGYLDQEKALKGPAKFDNILLVGENAYNAGLRTGKFDANIEDNGKYIFENNIDGDGGLRKTGIGTLILTGKNSYQGDTEIEKGTLEIYNQNMSNIFIRREGKLLLYPNVTIGREKSSDDNIFDGEIYGRKNVYNDGALEVKGEGAKIIGDYTATSNSKTMAEIGKTLYVDGKVKLNENSVVVMSGEPTYFSEKLENYSIIESKNNIDGNFYKVEGPELLNINSKVENNNVKLEINRKNIEKYVEHNDEMTKDTAENIEKLFKNIDEKIENNETVDKKIMGEVTLLQNETIRKNIENSLDSLSGQIHGSAQRIIFKQEEIINNNLVNRLSMLSNKNIQKEKYGIWTDIIGSNGKVSKKGYSSGKFDIYANQVGIDSKVYKNLIIGTVFSYSKGKIKFDRFGGKSNVENRGLSLYGRYENNLNTHYIQGRIGIGKTKSKVDREIILNNNRSGIETNYNNKMYSGYLETGYSYNKNDTSLTPYVAFLYNRLKRGDFIEENNEMALKADKKNYLQNSMLFGLKIDKNISLNEKKLKIYSYGSYRKSLNSQDLNFEARYKGINGNKIIVKGIGLPKESVLFGIGFLSRIHNNLEIYGKYESNIDIKRGHDNIFSTGFRLEF